MANDGNEWQKGKKKKWNVQTENMHKTVIWAFLLFLFTVCCCFFSFFPLLFWSLCKIVYFVFFCNFICIVRIVDPFHCFIEFFWTKQNKTSLKKNILRLSLWLPIHSHLYYYCFSHELNENVSEWVCVWASFCKMPFLRVRMTTHDSNQIQKNACAVEKYYFQSNKTQTFSHSKSLNKINFMLIHTKQSII